MPPATFEEKVEALRRLRDKRLEREEVQSQEDLPSATSLPEPVASAPSTASAPDDHASEGNSGPRPDPCGPGGVGEADALFCTGHCLERGLHGCAVDPSAAAAVYLEAAEQGHSVAQWRLGEMSEFGRGMAQNDAEAARWYRLAAEGGHVPAQLGLGLLLEAGRGCGRDDFEALRWFLKAAEAGDALAQYSAARCLLDGRGASRDVEAAVQWLRRSAAAGFGPAEEELAAAEEAPAESPARFNATSLLGVAERLAAQLRELDEEDAEAMLEELLQDAPSLFGQGDLEEEEEEEETGRDLTEPEPEEGEDGVFRPPCRSRHEAACLAWAAEPQPEGAPAT